MTKAEKLDLIAAYEGGFSQVEELVAGMGREELIFVPPLHEAWSTNDFLLHFLDAEISVAFRIRSAIAEPGKAVPAWEEEAWHDSLHYEDEDGLACLALATGIRGYVAASLRSVADADWAGFHIIHPVRGKLALDSLIELYVDHIAFHLPLIRRNMEAWRNRAG